jgi:Flp pilus assembly protein TadG
MRCIFRLIRRLKSLRTAADGQVAMIFGLAAIPVTVAAGMGIDMTQAYIVKVRLTAALDSAALAVGSSNPAKYTTAQLTTRMQNYFNANFPATSLVTNPMPLTPTMTVDPNDANIVNFAVSATVPTSFMRIVGINTMTVNASSQMTRGVSGLELALVLDNTGSMLCGDGGNSNCSQGVPPSHITSLVTYSNEIVNTLFSQSTDISKLRIAVVPYVTTVNVGPALSQSSTLNTYVPSPYKDIGGNLIKDFNNNNITYDSTQTENTPQWRGCVIEPTTSNEDTTGIGPDITEPNGGWAGPWTAFYWKPNTNASGTNDWNLTTKPISYLHQDGQVNYDWQNSKGPNNGCPTPIVRLTNTQTTLNNAINGLKAWDAGGTQIHIGMIWGWRVLSPNPPFSDGKPYNTTGWIKAVVLETDGVNEMPDSSHLTGLSFLADGKFGSTSRTTAINNLNNRLATVCTNMKNAGIVIYAVGLGAGGTSTTLQNCASDASKFFNAPDAASLQAAFQQIATSLNHLRISK